MIPLAFGLGGPWDIGIVAVVVMLLFGGSKLSGFGKNLGEGIKEFKKATHDEETPVSIAAPPASTTVITAAQPAAVAPVVAAAEHPAPIPVVTAAAPEEKHV